MPTMSMSSCDFRMRRRQPILHRPPATSQTRPLTNTRTVGRRNNFRSEKEGIDVDLRSKIHSQTAKIVDMTRYPKEGEPSRVLVIEMPLTTDMADVLKCRAMAFNLNDDFNK